MGVSDFNKVENKKIKKTKTKTSSESMRYNMKRYNLKKLFQVYILNKNKVFSTYKLTKFEFMFFMSQLYFDLLSYSFFTG